MQLLRTPVPASFFSVVLGLIGLGNTWHMAHQLWGYPQWLGEVVHTGAMGVWLLLLFLYAWKWTHHRGAAQAEMRHGVQGNFVALVPISSMLMALAVEPMSRTGATVVFVLGLLGWLTLTLYLGGRWFTGGLAAAQLGPALYLPGVAGNFSAALVCSRLGWAGWDQLFFGAGLMSWLALESVVLHRLATADPLPEALRATLGIQLAPPAVGLVAYLAVTPEPVALVAHMLLGYGLLQVLLLVRLTPWICQQGWSMAYWAVSFGVTGLALGAQRWLALDQSAPAQALAPVLFCLANGVLGLLLIGSVWGALPRPTPGVAQAN